MNLSQLFGYYSIIKSGVLRFGSDMRMLCVFETYEVSKSILKNIFIIIPVEVGWLGVRGGGPKNSACGYQNQV